VVVAMQQLSLFDETLLSSPPGEARGDDGKAHQATAASERTKPMVVDLMDRVVNRENLIRALKRVRANKGSPGIDGMTVDDLTGYLREHWQPIRERLLRGDYCPQPVKEVSIPKPGGGTRRLGIPTVLDWFIQQAILDAKTGSRTAYLTERTKEMLQTRKKAKEDAAKKAGKEVTPDELIFPKRTKTTDGSMAQALKILCKSCWNIGFE
jgi:hypothetical protein